jgi:hypothetical protein
VNAPLLGVVLNRSTRGAAGYGYGYGYGYEPRELPADDDRWRLTREATR